MSRSKKNDDFDFQIAFIELKSGLEMTHSGIENIKDEFNLKMNNMKDIYDNNLSYIKETIVKIEKRINGNGKKGIVDDLDDIKKDVLEIKTEDRLKKDNTARNIAIGGFILAIITLIMQLV
jgi:hypothetical protein